MIPSKTGAAEAVGLVLPELAGKLTGMSVRVPVINVSLVDLTLNVGRQASAEEINGLLKHAAEQSKVLGYNTLPLVSTDFNHNPLSSIFDANHTKVNGKLVKVMAWYDNEWGFSNRMLDNCLALCNAQ
jgi:glyceraldehyde 3-phosphate dehydrogenase